LFGWVNPHPPTVFVLELQDYRAHTGTSRKHVADVQQVSFGGALPWDF
jgi:hypothetical protein